MNFTPTQISAVCKQFGPQLQNLPFGVDGIKVLWGLAGNESSFGRNCAPRFEPAYYIGGHVYATNLAQQHLVQKFGKDAACSWGPFQLMFINAPNTYIPADMLDLTKVTAASIHFLNNQLAHFKPNSLGSIGAIWNQGHPSSTLSPSVQAYVNAFVRNYSTSLAA